MSLEAPFSTEIPAYSYAGVVEALLREVPEGEGLPQERLIDQIGVVEQLERACQAARAELSALLLAEMEVTLPTRQAFLAAAGEVGLARGMSSSAGARSVELGMVLDRMPSVSAAFRHGLVAQDTVHAICKALPSLDDDAIDDLDHALEEHLPGLRPRLAAELVRAFAIEIDLDAADAKAVAARDDQFVIVVDENDGMATLIARGPAEEVHATKDVLLRRAKTAKAAGDSRTRGQVMFQSLVESALNGPGDLLVQRVVEVGVVVTAEYAAGLESTAPILVGHGPVAPAVLDEILCRADLVFYRRLFTDPVNGTLTGFDTTRRLFDGPVARFVRTRDGHRCRGAHCESAIAELDHVIAHEVGGRTTARNGQGQCKLDHLIKHLPGWKVEDVGDGALEWTTPSNQTYVSRPPPLIRRRR